MQMKLELYLCDVELIITLWGCILPHKSNLDQVGHEIKQGYPEEWELQNYEMSAMEIMMELHVLDSKRFKFTGL